MLVARGLLLPHRCSFLSFTTARRISLFAFFVHTGLPESPEQVTINMQKDMYACRWYGDGQCFPNAVEHSECMKHNEINLPP